MLRYVEEDCYKFVNDNGSIAFLFVREEDCLDPESSHADVWGNFQLPGYDDILHRPGQWRLGIRADILDAEAA